MTFSSYFAFVAATAILMAIPGPNVAAIVSASVAGGATAGLRIVLGAATAMVLQLALVAVGLSSLLSMAGGAFEVLRWIGVAYLAFLGLRMLMSPGPGGSTDGANGSPSSRSLLLRGFLVSLTNPKTLLFYGAFFPQFLPATDAGGQHPAAVVILAVTFLAIALVMDSTWAMLAGRLRPLLLRDARTVDRFAGSMLLGGALALSLTRSK